MFKIPKQFLEHKSEKTTTVFSSLGCRVNPGTASKLSDQDKDPILMPKPHMTEAQSPEDRKVIENEKQMLHDSSTGTKEKFNSQSSSCKYAIGTMEIKHCAIKPLALKKESEKTASSCNEHSELSKNHTETKKEELKEKNNSKSNINTRNASQSAEGKHVSSSGKGSESQVCFPKHLITVQIPKVCSSKPQITPPPTLNSQISDKKESANVSSLQIQVSSSSDKNQTRLSKPVISEPVTTKPSPEQVCFPQTTTATPVTRYQVGSLGFKTATPITTVPIRSGLRLLSIISTESAPKVQITATPTSTPKPTAKQLPDISTAKVPSTKDGVSISPGNTSKTSTMAKSTVSTQQSPTLKAGIHPNSPLTTPKTPTTVVANPSSTTTPQKSTIDTSLTTTPQKPSSTSLSNVVIVSPQTSPIKNVVGTLRSHITTPQATKGVAANTPTSLISMATPVCSSQITPPLKENESPRTPQSEPTFKTWIPPPDIDPMSQTFLRMPFIYQSLQVQCNHGNRPHVKRPMNAFMVWAKKNRSSIAKRFPNASNAEISVRLGHIWNELPSDEQKPYFDEAGELKEKHKHENPNWVYQPRPGKKCRKALFTSTTSKSQPTSPVARRIIAKGYDRPIHPRSAPNSPAVKRPLWLPRKTDLSEEELQSRIVEDLLDDEVHENAEEEGTGNPTMDRYIDEWLSPKRTKRDENELCLMNDAMLPAVNDDEQNILEEETRCDGRDFEKYIKQLKTERNNFTKLENNISNLEEDDEIECA